MSAFSLALDGALTRLVKAATTALERRPLAPEPVVTIMSTNKVLTVVDELRPQASTETRTALMAALLSNPSIVVVPDEDVLR